jgi:hypothetical protein
MAKLQEKIGADGVDRYLTELRRRESGRNPDGTTGNYQQGGNQFSFIGAYQVGAPALIDQGLVKPGTTNAGLNNVNNWNLPGGKPAFLNNPALQDKVAVDIADRNIARLEQLKVLSPNDPPERVAGLAGASHLLGADGVYNKGLEGVDGNGTKGASYYKSLAGAVSGKKGVEVPTDVKTGAGTGTSATGEKKPSGVPFTGAGVALKKTGVPNSVTITASKAVEAIPLPIPNPLTKFTSFNAVITLSCLTTEQFNFPEKSYKAGDIGNILLRSAGAGSKAQPTGFRSSFNTAGQYDFHIDNLEIDSLISFDERTKGSNANLISFEVYEPYSMGIFLQAANQVAIDSGHVSTGYYQAPFLLTIEFIGWDNNGKSVTIPNTSRHIPIHLTEVDMTVKASGCVYKVQALAANEIALADNNNLFKTDIAISGSTVQEILQTGEFSLQTVLNKRLQEYASQENVKTAFDEIVIVFPKDVVEPVTPVNENENSAKKDSTEPRKNVVLNGSLSVSRAPGALLKQEKDSLNYLGASSMDFNSGQAGEPEVVKLDNAHTTADKPAQRDKVTFNTKTRQFVFSQGTTIVNAISKVLSQCKHCKDVVDSRRLDDNGMIDWFRIETQILMQTPSEGNSGKNDYPKLIIFKVVPFKTSGASLLSPNAEPVGLDNLKKEAAKIYDYMYTGQNTEILDFDISYKGAFFSTAPADQLKGNASAGTSTQQSQTTSDTGPTTPNSAPGQHERGAPRQQPGYDTGKSSPDSGGTLAIDNKTIAAQQFQKSLYESQVSMVDVTMKILGDPYYLADSGLGNFSNSGTGRFNVTKSGAMDYQSGDVDVLINFRTPLDYNASTGIMDFGNSQIVSQFSGLYRVNQVSHKFNKGKYTQELKMLRRTNQNPVPDSNTAQTASAEKGKRLTQEQIAANARRNFAATDPRRIDLGKAKIIDLSNSTKYTDGSLRKSAAGPDSATANPNKPNSVVKVSNTSNVLPVPGVVPANAGQKFGLGTGLYGQ